MYVDSLEDPQLDRSRVTSATAEVLRTRMDHCGFLVYVPVFEVFLELKVGSLDRPRLRWSHALPDQ